MFPKKFSAYISAFFLFGFLLFTQFSFALVGKAVLTNDSFFCVYLNLGKIYSMIFSELKNIDDLQNAAVKAQLKELFETAKSNFSNSREKARGKACSANLRVILGAVEMYNLDKKDMITTNLNLKELVKEQYLESEPMCPDQGKYQIQGDVSKDGRIVCTIHGDADNASNWEAKNPSKASSDTFEDFIKKIFDFDSKGLFRPTGGLWIAASKDLSPRIVIEASCKPKEFYEFLFGNNPAPIRPEKVEKDLVVFKLPRLPNTNKDLTLELRPDGLVFGDVPAAPESNLEKNWQPLIDFIAGPEVVSAIEIDGTKLVDLISAKNSGVDNFKPSGPPKLEATLPDPRIKSLKRIRLWAGNKKIQLVAAIESPEDRNSLKKDLFEGFQKGKDQVQQQMMNLNDPKAELKKILDKVTVVDKEDLIGFAIEGIEPTAMLTAGAGITGILAAIAVPNFQKGNAQKEACYANMRVIRGALELYDLDNPTPLDSLDFNILISKKYLKSEPKCPKKGVYKIIGIGKDRRVVCSYHGMLPE